MSARRGVRPASHGVEAPPRVGRAERSTHVIRRPRCLDGRRGLCGLLEVSLQHAVGGVGSVLNAEEHIMGDELAFRIALAIDVSLVHATDGE